MFDEAGYFRKISMVSKSCCVSTYGDFDLSVVEEESSVSAAELVFLSLGEL